MDTRWLIIRQLDQQLREWRVVSLKHGRPKEGWVKTLRVALRMSVEQLAYRLPDPIHHGDGVCIAALLEDR